jgi:hypothetical protein
VIQLGPDEISARPDDRLALKDQAFFAGHRAAGQQEIMQVAWLYERPVDMDHLRRFHRNLGSGLLGRRIERSPLPFGRYRWVADNNPSQFDIAERARPRDELADWLDERSLLPIDPEAGPGWRLSVVPFDDGSTAVTLVISHYVVDGIGAVVAVALASMGENLDLGYPPPRSRSTVRALVQDAGQAALDAPAAARALVSAAKEARRRREDGDRTPQRIAGATAAASAEDAPITVPAIWIRIKMDEWNARAEALGGTTSTLAVALTAKLDRYMGRQHGDADDVTMLLLVNDRTPGDLRAIAVSFARLSIDPTEVTTDLRGTRAAVKQGLQILRETPDESSELIVLTPFTPKPAWRQLIDFALNDPDQPAVCSNLGDTGPAVIRPDGTPSDSAFARGTSQHLTRRWLDRMGSQLQLYFGTSVEINAIGIHIRAYDADSVTSKAALRDLASRTLAEFGLTGEFD